MVTTIIPTVSIVSTGLPSDLDSTIRCGLLIAGAIMTHSTATGTIPTHRSDGTAPGTPPTITALGTVPGIAHGTPAAGTTLTGMEMITGMAEVVGTMTVAIIITTGTGTRVLPMECMPTVQVE